MDYVFCRAAFLFDLVRSTTEAADAVLEAARKEEKMKEKEKNENEKEIKMKGDGKGKVKIGMQIASVSEVCV